MGPKRKSAFAIRRTASSEGVWTPLPVLLRLQASHLLAALTYEEIEKNVVRRNVIFRENKAFQTNKIYTSSCPLRHSRPLMAVVGR